MATAVIDWLFQTSGVSNQDGTRVAIVNGATGDGTRHDRIGAATDGAALRRRSIVQSADLTG